MNNKVFLGLSLLGWGLSLAGMPIQGSVTERGIVAVEIPPILRTQTSRKSPSAFVDEFRVRDSKGECVPYIIRPRTLPRIEHETRWQSLRVVSVRETNGQLTVEAEWPNRSRGQLTAGTVRIDTPLTDFEQKVTVSVHGKKVAEARLCDYSRFAQFRQIEFQVPGLQADRLSFTFSRPTSEQEAATFERMITARGDGTVDAQNIRRQVTERPFQVTGLAVSYQVEVTRHELAEPNFVPVVSERREDAERHCTYICFNAGNLPVIGLQTDFTHGNYDREVELEVLRGPTWISAFRGRVHAIDLADRQENHQQLYWSEPKQCEMCRLVVRNGDSPLLKGNPARLIRLACPSEEVVFIAEPGEHYEGMCVAGAKRPTYDATVRSVLERAFPSDDRLSPSVRTLRFEIPKDLQPLDLPRTFGPVPATPNWLLKYGVEIASALVFIVLILVCFRLFRLTTPPQS